MAAAFVQLPEGLNMIIGLLSLILTTVLPIVLIVWAVRQFGNRNGPRGTDSHSVRRFFQYLLLYGLMIVAATGVSDLLGLLLQGPILAGDDRSTLARALTFSVFGIPMFVLLAAWSRRRLQQDRDEARSFGWAFYATVAPLTALVAAMIALHDVVSTVLAGDRFDWAALSQVGVWAGLWFVHWTVAKRMLDADRRQGQLVLGSLIGLGTSIFGLVWLLGASLDALLMDEARILLVGQEHPLAQAAATVATGVPVWVVYWIRNLSRSHRTPLWFIYVLPVGVGGSLVLSVVGASIVLYKVLVWLVGDPVPTEAARYFEGTPTAGACVVIGAFSWWYHQQVLAAATPERSEISRVYEYLMAGIALLAATVGMAMVIAALVESLLPTAAVEVGTSAVDSLLSGVTLLVVGGPLWWVFWSRIRQATRGDSVEELGSPTRRTYLFVLFGVGGVTAVISVLVAAFLGLQGALQGGIDAQVVREMRIPVAILLATGAVSGYHWAVYRDDRSRLPVKVPRRGPRYVLLIGTPEGPIAGAVERLTGARVDQWVRADGLARPWAVDEVAAAVNESGADAIAVVAGSAGLETIEIHRPRGVTALAHQQGDGTKAPPPG